VRSAECGMNLTRARMLPGLYSAFPPLRSASPMPRLDQALVDRGLCESREKAKRAIMAGRVRINLQTARKPSDLVRPDDQLALEGGDQYVSRGGHKLEHALHHFVEENPARRHGAVKGRLQGGCPDQTAV